MSELLWFVALARNNPRFFIVTLRIQDSFECPNVN